MLRSKQNYCGLRPLCYAEAVAFRQANWARKKPREAQGTVGDAAATARTGRDESPHLRDGRPGVQEQNIRYNLLMTVDEFVKTKVLPEYQDIVTMLRELVHEMDPDVKESISYGIPVFRRKLIFAVISPTKQDITFAFSRGAEFEDQYGLLQGVGKVSKHVKIKSLDTVNKEALKYYIKQALELDAK